MLGVEQKISLPVEATEGEYPLTELQVGFEHWSGAEEEGKLSVDVAETNEELIVTAPMAGTPPANIELHLHNDLLTIRGERPAPAQDVLHYFHHECYWGKFSRTVVLPADVKAELAQAEYRYGVLNIRLPKVQASGNIPILIMEE
jgi:HSP20 family protein